MKIAILLESNHSGGGGFTHSISTTYEMIKYLGNLNNEVTVYTHLAANSNILNKLGITAELYKNNIVDKFLIKFSVYKVFRIIFKFLKLKISIEKILLKKNTDIIFFPSASIATLLTG